MIRRDYDLMQARAEFGKPSWAEENLRFRYCTSIKPAIEKSLIFSLAPGASEHE